MGKEVAIGLALIGVLKHAAQTWQYLFVNIIDCPFILLGFLRVESF